MACKRQTRKGVCEVVEVSFRLTVRDPLETGSDIRGGGGRVELDESAGRALAELQRMCVLCFILAGE